MSKPLSDYWLERYALNELPAGKREEIRRQLETDDMLRQRLAGLKLSNEAILRQYPSGRLAAVIQQRARATAPAPVPVPARIPRWAFASAALAAAVLAVWLLPGGPLPWQHFGLKENTTRLKGMVTELMVYRQRAGGAQRLQPYAYARQGDLLQIAYVSLTEPYGAVLSLDGRGTVTLHFPENAGLVPKLQTRHKVLLPKAYELDNAPGYERFFLVTSAAPFSPETVLQAARTLAKNPQRALADDLPLGRTWRQYSLVIQKENR